MATWYNFVGNPTFNLARIAYTSVDEPADEWYAQTLVPLYNLNVSKLGLSTLCLPGTNVTGTVTLSIRAINDANEPIGSDMRYGSAAIEFGAPQVPTWQDVELNANYIFLAGYTYCIVAHIQLSAIPMPSTVGVGTYNYANGSLFSSVDGESWSSYGSYDMVVGLYGSVYVPPSPSEPADITDFPTTRPDGYDPDLIWTPDDWTDDVYTPSEWDEPAGNYTVAGGGRWGQNLIAVGKDLIYYEAIE